MRYIMYYVDYWIFLAGIMWGILCTYKHIHVRYIWVHAFTYHSYTCFKDDESYQDLHESVIIDVILCGNTVTQFENGTCLTNVTVASHMNRHTHCPSVTIHRSPSHLRARCHVPAAAPMCSGAALPGASVRSPVPLPVSPLSPSRSSAPGQCATCRPRLSPCRPEPPRIGPSCVKCRSSVALNGALVGARPFAGERGRVGGDSGASTT